MLADGRQQANTEMDHNTPPHLRLMPQATRDHAQRLRQEYKNDPEKVRRHQKEVSRIFQTAKLNEASFGGHWQWISNNLRDGTWTMRDLIRACHVIKRMPRFGLHPLLVKKVHLVTIVGNPKHLKAGVWSERAGFMLEELNLMVQKDIIKESAGGNSEQVRLRFPHGD